MTSSKRILILVLLPIAILLILGASKFLMIRKAMSQRPVFPPAAVTSAKVQEMLWPQTIKLVGSLEPVQGVILKNEEAGVVKRIRYESGQIVKKDQILVELDTTVEQAQADIAKANFQLANNEMIRNEKLFRVGAISRAQYDSVLAKFKTQKSDTERVAAILMRRTIKAPFAGKTGIRRINEGQYLSPGSEVCPLYTHDQIYLNFEVPQQYINFLALSQKIEFKIDGEDSLFSSEISSIDPVINTDSRSFKVQAIINNNDGKLQPGMFTTLELALGTPEKVLVIPSSAVMFAPYGNSVYQITQLEKPDGSKYLGAKQVFVKLGDKRGDLVVLLNGLNANDELVTSGAFKLQPNAEIQINNEVTPDANLNATPADS